MTHKILNCVGFQWDIGNSEKNFDSIVPRVSLAAPYIHKGLDPGIAAGLLVMVEAVPFCLMKVRFRNLTLT